MLLMELPTVLEMPSNDAPSYRRCADCGESWYQWDTRPCNHTARSISCHTVGHIIQAKRRDGQYQALLADIAQNGKDTPAIMSGGYMWNGHHGIAALVELGWSEIPVTESYTEYMSSEEASSWEEGSPELGY